MKNNMSAISGWASRAGVAVTAAAAAVALTVSPASASPLPVFAAAPLAAAVPVAAVAAPLASATQAVSFDAQMIQLVNRARAAAGAPALTEAKGLTQLSVWWSSQMQNGKTGYNLQHNPNAWTMVTSYGASNRTSWGENVAWSSSTGTTATQLFTAYMNSPDHKANILAPNYRFIGMGTVTGAHGLFNTTEFTNAVQAGQAVVPPAPVTPIVNGDFVRSTTTGAVYRIVGGAPVYVSSWSAFGKAQTTKPITQAKLAAMRLYPADGTFVRAAGNYSVYRIVGGAPVYVSNWTAFGGTQATVYVDPAAISHAGAAGVWSHLRAAPADGIFIRTPGSNATYRMAGGAPIYVASWAPFGGAKTTYAVDPAAVSHAGQAGVWSHIKMYPSTPTYLQAAGASPIYKAVGGKLTRLASWPVAGATTYTVVHPMAISLAGSGGYYNHLKK